MDSLGFVGVASASIQVRSSVQRCSLVQSRTVLQKSARATLVMQDAAVDADIKTLAPLNKRILQERVAETVTKSRLHDNDCGSPEAQISKLTVKIEMLTQHAKANPKDHSSTRGLIKMVSTRKRLLKYLRDEDPARFEKIVSSLNIRLSKDMTAVVGSRTI
eukprot:CAMPEP_0184691560 /NCGR_PEP_ID=MMETSP0313-20130426/377_1 /TAXON_ID=2792 /ORGANISM="Porphyridium aerugineum, Strain SAG 1380-2" /LENGTH=160 /DNA_ID=CAMNT_0027149303 /DNA_START=151 /DNA_END=633 /DNA_ORIENTATION=-